jgi:hypothetical protein
MYNQIKIGQIRAFGDHECYIVTSKFKADLYMVKWLSEMSEDDRSRYAISYDRIVSDVD